MNRGRYDVYIHTGILLSHKKNEIIPFAATWMDLEIIKLNEVSQKEERYIPSDITYMWNLKNMIKRTYLQNRERFTDLESRFVVAWGGEREG